MFRKIALSDLRKNKFISGLLILFIIVAAALLSCAAGLIMHLSGSINELMDKAQTPDFMQMHTGTIDYERLEAFARRTENIKEYQVLEFLNVDGSNIRMGDSDLSESMIDLGFSVQSPKFDYLLDLEGNIITVGQGEIYVPICYKKENRIQVGDVMTVCQVPLKIAGFLRDSQMNSSMASSKRFLIHEADYKKLAAYGSVEYLIEFKGYKREDAGKIESAYMQAGLEANGPAITYKLFYLINAMSDGLMIAVIILMSILIVLISFLCIRFTLLAKLEDDYREIGIMKAIGLHYQELQEIYLTKYRYIAAIGCLIGYGFSFVIKGILLKNISLYMGEGGSNILSGMIGVFGIVVLYFWIISYVKRILKRIKMVSAESAIREGRAPEGAGAGKAPLLIHSGWMHPNIYMGIQAILKHKKMYITMLVVLILSVFILLVPQNMYQTISDESFINFMGVGKCDARIDLQQLTEIEEKANQVEEWLKADGDVKSYGIYVTSSYSMKKEDGVVEYIKIEAGDFSKFPIDYIKGNRPEADTDIALSYLNAQELGKSVGDTISILVNNNWTYKKICGIYSDVTNGGKTAKMLNNNSSNVMWYNLCIDYKKGISVSEKIAEYENTFQYGKIAEVKEYIKQTLGGTIDNLKTVSLAAIILTICITVLITALFLRLLIAKDRYSIAVMRSLGFTNRDISVQYATRAITVLIISIILGTLLSNTIGVMLAGAAISGLGVASFHFAIKPLIVYALFPALLFCVVLVTSLASTHNAGKITIVEQMKEGE